MVARATESASEPSAKRAPRPRRRHAPHQVLAVALGFALAAACFVASTLFADSRLELVARRTRDVSDNAMPSIVHVATMRRELARAQYELEDSTSGAPGEPLQLPAQFAAMDQALAQVEEARRFYESYPRFPGESALWADATKKLDNAEDTMSRVRAELEVGRGQDAAADVHGPLAAAVAGADDAVSRVLRLNYDQGALTATAADHAWRRARELGLALDGISVVITAGLGIVALRSMRRQSAISRARADELEAFASRVAHDVRSPLSPVSLALEQAARDPGTANTTRVVVERGLRSLRRVDGLVQDLLTFARAGAAPEPDSRASLDRVASEVVQDVEPQAATTSVRVSIGDLPRCQMHCPAGVLASVLHNLVSNAIKYMPPDATDRRVWIDGTRRGGRMHVEVADSGAGIPADLRENIFQPYVRANRRQPGLGLGLATVRRLVEAYGGRVGCRSPRRGGSVFWFELPCSPPAADEERPRGVDVT